MTVALLHGGEKEVGVTGAMLMGEEEGVAGAGPEKEVEEVAVLEGR